MQLGNFPIKYASDGKTIEIASKPAEKRDFNGRSYILQNALKGEFALVKAWKADELGNSVFRKSARNFNPDVATAGKTCIVEVEEIVPVGSIPPEDVHLPSCFVNRLVLGKNYEKRIEFRTMHVEG